MNKAFLLLLFLAVSAAAQEKTFIREYVYNASEDDSRNSARKKALGQVKALLLEEVGIYVEGTTTAPRSASTGAIVGSFAV